MQLIDWWGVAANGLWVVGLATLLAAFSLADYRAAGRKRLRQALGERAFQLPCQVGMALFALGLCATSRTWWERGLWALLALAFGWQAYRAAREGT